MRESALGRTDVSTSNQVHFVSVPDFLTPDSPCHAVHNVRVLSLEVEKVTKKASSRLSLCWPAV